MITFKYPTKHRSICLFPLGKRLFSTRKTPFPHSKNGFFRLVIRLFTISKPPIGVFHPSFSLFCVVSLPFVFLFRAVRKGVFFGKLSLRFTPWFINLLMP